MGVAAVATVVAIFGTGCGAATRPAPPVMISLAVPGESVRASTRDVPATREALVPDAPPSKEKESDDAPVASCTTPKGSTICSLTPKDIQHVCRSGSPQAALKAFAQGSKLSRGFLRGDVDVWSSVHRARTSKGRARLDEEVLVLSETRMRGGIVMTGSAVSYEVLRWNGQCATLSSGEMTLKRSPRALPPRRPLDFAKLDPSTLEWLRSDAALDRLEDAREIACSPARSAASRACEVASTKRDAALGSFLARNPKAP